MKRTTKLMAWTLALLAAACVPAGEEGSNELGVEVPEIEESSGLALMFQGAAEQSGVPVDVLKALAYVETQFEPAIGEVEFDGQPEPYGLFGLGGDRLQ